MSKPIDNIEQSVNSLRSFVLNNLNKKVTSATEAEFYILYSNFDNILTEAENQGFDISEIVNEINSKTLTMSMDTQTIEKFQKFFNERISTFHFIKSSMLSN